MLSNLHTEWEQRILLPALKQCIVTYRTFLCAKCICILPIDTLKAMLHPNQPSQDDDALCLIFSNCRICACCSAVWQRHLLFEKKTSQNPRYHYNCFPSLLVQGITFFLGWCLIVLQTIPTTESPAIISPFSCLKSKIVPAAIIQPFVTMTPNQTNTIYGQLSAKRLQPQCQGEEVSCLWRTSQLGHIIYCMHTQPVSRNRKTLNIQLFWDHFVNRLFMLYWKTKSIEDILATANGTGTETQRQRGKSLTVSANIQVCN